VCLSEALMKGTRYFVILSEAKDLCTCSGTMHRSFAVAQDDKPNFWQKAVGDEHYAG
jgi:hypothetical protein